MLHAKHYQNQPMFHKAIKKIPHTTIVWSIQRTIPDSAEEDASYAAAEHSDNLLQPPNHSDSHKHNDHMMLLLMTRVSTTTDKIVVRKKLHAKSLHKIQQTQLSLGKVDHMPMSESQQI